MTIGKPRISLLTAIGLPIVIGGALLLWRTGTAVCNYTGFTGECALWQTCSGWSAGIRTEYQCYTGLHTCCYCETEVITCTNPSETKYRQFKRKKDNMICIGERTNRMPCIEPGVSPPPGG